jgi:CMP-N-acetylneuraminic acid synthetase
MIGLITARGGSKGIPNKNMVLLKNKPLLYFTIKAAKKSVLKEIWITSDSKDILNYAESQGIKCITRPKHLAQDNTPSIEVVKHAVSIIGEENTYCLLQPTSPLRNFKHINEAFEVYKNCNSTTKSLVSVSKLPHNFSPKSLMTMTDGILTRVNQNEKIFRRQDKKTYYARNGAAIYIFNSKDIIKSDYKILNGTILSYEMDKIFSLDIDEPIDIHIAELYLNLIKNESIKERFISK